VPILCSARVIVFALEQTWFVWTLHALGVIGLFSLILSVRGLWSLRRGQLR